MSLGERTPLVQPASHPDKSLRLLFAVICIVDVFGVFPLIALPKPILDCGFAGVVLVALICTLQLYTAVLLGQTWVLALDLDRSLAAKSRYPYAALAELTYGPHFSNFVSVLVNVTIFGGSVPNLMVAAQNLQGLGSKVSGGAVEVSSCYWVIVLGVVLCPVLWLGSPKNMKLLCSISVGIVVVVFFLLLVAIASTRERHQPPEVPPSPLLESLLMSFGVISFQFDIHPTILTIQNDMEEPSRAKTALLAGFGASIGMFLVGTVLVALKFGTIEQPSVLDALEPGVSLHLGAFLVALQLCLSSAISNNALYQQMEECLQIARAFNYRRCILRVTITFFAILIAEIVPRFDLVMSLIGGALTAPLIFIFPTLFHLKVLGLRRKRAAKLELCVRESLGSTIYSIEETTQGLEYGSSKYTSFFSVLLLIFGVFSTVASTYFNVKNTIVTFSFSRPCILNITEALVRL